MSHEPGIVLRKARSADCERLFAWRNHERVRAVSLNPEPIGWDGHQAWFLASLSDSGRDLLIGEVSSEPVGVLRFDVSGNEALVSVYLAPEKMGQGYGSRLLRNGIQWIAGHRPEVLRLKAEILSDNPASMKAFEKAGYRRMREDDASAPRADEGQTKTVLQEFRQVLRYEYIIEPV